MLGLRRAPRLFSTAVDSARFFTNIPVIDVAALVDETASSNTKHATAKELHAACKDVGFFYVKSHGVSEEVSNGVRETAREWFNLPDTIKHQIALSPEKHYRGYQALGANVTRYEGGFQRDWHEGIDLYKEEYPENVKKQGWAFSPIHGVNQWPVQHAPFDVALRKYIESMTVLGGQLVGGIALGLGLDDGFFERTVSKDPYWCVRVIHYPPLSEAQGQQQESEGALPEETQKAAAREDVERTVQLSCGEHSDYGMLTIVNQDPHVSALQVKNANNEWISADPIPGTFVCNIGDMFQVWTNGLYTPTLHRVINTNSGSRISIPYFYEPDYEATVEPLSPFCTENNPPRYKPRRYGSHLESKVLNNFELQ